MNWFCSSYWYYVSEWNLSLFIEFKLILRLMDNEFNSLISELATLLEKSNKLMNKAIKECIKIDVENGIEPYLD